MTAFPSKGHYTEHSILKQRMKWCRIHNKDMWEEHRDAKIRMKSFITGSRPVTRTSRQLPATIGKRMFATHGVISQYHHCWRGWEMMVETWTTGRQVVSSKVVSARREGEETREPLVALELWAHNGRIKRMPIFFRLARLRLELDAFHGLQRSSQPLLSHF